MYIGNRSSNYYQQYYPYVGAYPEVFSSRQYDNGKLCIYSIWRF